MHKYLISLLCLCINICLLYNYIVLLTGIYINVQRIVDEPKLQKKFSVCFPILPLALNKHIDQQTDCSQIHPA
ncbi:hypothetical protein GGD38_007357 [Chitinophagaceae bacterium OAS944]|nr:hypothetical protein [Chitinophagaceae bacterium OAS944]